MAFRFGFRHGRVPAAFTLILSRSAGQGRALGALTQQGPRKSEPRPLGVDAEQFVQLSDNFWVSESSTAR